MTDSEQHYSITLEEYLKFREFYYRKTGNFFDDSKRYFVDKRLHERILATESAGFRDYFVLLRFDAAGKELQSLINLMTVNETYFYREDYQFKCMINSILPDLIRRRERDEALRIWSVPCSTGEEAYSIAIYLLEYWKDIDRYEVELSASDIDTKVLAEALEGEYRQRAIAQMPATIVNKYFIAMGGGRYIIKKELREAISFSTVNVANLIDMKHHRDYDLIFCRNLLIYFDDTSRRQVADGLYDALRPGGYICLGHSESMSRITSLFKVKKFADAIVYQKPI